MAAWEEFPLAGDDGVSPEDEVGGAAQSALDAADDVPVAAVPSPVPFGMTWLFDPMTRRFARAGGAPVVVTGQSALVVWATTTLCTRKGVWPIFSGDYGVEGLTEMVGKVVGPEDVSEAEDWIRDALTVHDRISDVVDVVVRVGRLSTLGVVPGIVDAADAQAVFVERFTIVTDEGDRIPVGGITITGSS